MSKPVKKQLSEKQPKISPKEQNRLQVKKRDIFGKKVKSLRRQNILPANIYGSDFKSTAVQVNIIDFKKILKTAGETQIVHINIDQEKNDIPVLIQNIATHPITGNYLHADFRKVDLKKKIQTSVPIKISGESAAVVQNTGVLQLSADTLMIEALPDQIPSQIEIDITNLSNVGDELCISKIKTEGNYTFVDDPEKVVVRIIEHKEEEITPQVQEPVAEQEAEESTESAEDKKEEPADKKEEEQKKETES